jgi:uncharacterized membrane protein YesL
MKTNLQFPAVLALMTLQIKGFSQDQDFYIFPCFGQSNIAE